MNFTEIPNQEPPADPPPDQPGPPESNSIRPNRSNIALYGLFILALVYTLHFAASLLIPIFIAGFLSLLLAPVVRKLARIGIPRMLSSAVLVAGVCALLITALLTLAQPAEKWISEAPRQLRDLQRQASPAKDRLEDIKKIAEEVEELSDVETSPEKPSVVIQEASALERFLLDLPNRVAAFVLIIFLTFFLLISGHDFLKIVSTLGRTWSDRRKIVVVARHIQRDVSSYLGTVTLINSLLGVATGIAMYLLGVPNPILWAVIVAILNIAPYVGALVSLFLLTVAGFTVFDTVAEALAVPGVFLVLTTLEGQILTPLILGRRMAINATIIFLSVVFWGWLWGIAGALMAVPIVTSIMVILTHFPPLKPLGRILEVNRTILLLPEYGKLAARANPRHQPESAKPPDTGD